jgi:hypothetical protein
MSVTGLELGGCISLYVGICLVRASLYRSRADSPEPDSVRKVEVLGYFLLAAGLLIIAISLFRYFH